MLILLHLQQYFLYIFQYCLVCTVLAATGYNTNCLCKTRGVCACACACACVCVCVCVDKSHLRWVEEEWPLGTRLPPFTTSEASSRGALGKEDWDLTGWLGSL
jgi:hypothetical protein